MYILFTLLLHGRALMTTEFDSASGSAYVRIHDSVHDLAFDR